MHHNKTDHLMIIYDVITSSQALNSQPRWPAKPSLGLSYGVLEDLHLFFWRGGDSQFIGKNLF